MRLYKNKRRQRQATACHADKTLLLLQHQASFVGLSALACFQAHFILGARHRRGRLEGNAEVTLSICLDALIEDAAIQAYQTCQGGHRLDTDINRCTGSATSFQFDDTLHLSVVLWTQDLQWQLSGTRTVAVIDG